MNIRRISLPGLLIAFALTGCAQSFDATNLGVPATMASASGDEAAAAGQPFRVSAHTVHGLWGLVPLGKARLDKALAAQLVGGKEVAQLKIHTKSRWSDLLFTALTLGIIAPKTVIYEGVIIGR